MPQSRAATAPPRTRTQQIAIAILALLLIALLGFYTLVTGRITDGSARLNDGAQARRGAAVGTARELATAPARPMPAPANFRGAKIPGIATNSPRRGELEAGASQLATGPSRSRRRHQQAGTGVYKVDDGAQKLAAGQSAPPDADGRPTNGLADGATRPTAALPSSPTDRKLRRHRPAQGLPRATQSEAGTGRPWPGAGAAAGAQRPVRARSAGWSRTRSPRSRRRARKPTPVPPAAAGAGRCSGAGQLTRRTPASSPPDSPPGRQAQQP